MIHGDLEVVDYVKRDDEDTRVSARPSYERIDSSPNPRSDSDEYWLTKNEPSSREEQLNWGHCDYCQAVIVLSNSKFCSNCGASLGHRLEDATPVGMKEKTKLRKKIELMAKHGKKCMVCNLELGGDDDVVWCPNCGSPAHRDHLLEWIHVKNNCPICGERLTEQSFKGS
jgi:rRNA maturation endonuclease Nob1